ncbi:hypothetical protein GGR50DRAFT_472421 [Xylaria sp. CBS 124048]|nr:hypothetical protein GGR50DRAFT_472421 [Xylaria sp. CBS 124048]
MAGDHPRRAHLPRQDHYEGSQYPPIPSVEIERPRITPPQARSQPEMVAVNLPSIHGRPDMYQRTWDSRNLGYGPSPAPSQGYPPPTGGASSTAGSCFSPAGSSSAYPPPAGPHSSYPLPPVQPHVQDGRGNYPESRQDFYTSQPPAHFNGSGPGYEYPYRPERGPPGPYPPDYPRGGSAGGGVISHGQSAPRQRTSIACKYCRRRKIRCSGYASSPGGKCTNCIKMNQECVFQPVSSTSSTAFVPVSALPGGVPPGIQLFGAYGQPIVAPTTYSSNNNYQATTPLYDQPLPSPTGSNNSYWEDRIDSRRRHMLEDDHGVRLPPPNSFPDENVQRRSPSSGSPKHLQPFNTSQPQPIPRQGLESRPSPPRGSPSGASGTSVMNIENLMSSNSPGNDIDQSMLGRLNRRGK